MPIGRVSRALPLSRQDEKSESITTVSEIKMKPVSEVKMEPSGEIKTDTSVSDKSKVDVKSEDIEESKLDDELEEPSPDVFIDYICNLPLIQRTTYCEDTLSESISLLIKIKNNVAKLGLASVVDNICVASDLAHFMLNLDAVMTVLVEKST